MCSNDKPMILALKTYVIPLLEYCSPVWSPSGVTDILKLESVQRSFTRSVKCCNSLSYRERLVVCELRSLKWRRLVADLNLFYKIVNNITDINLSNVIQPISYNSTRGHSKRFVIPTARLNCQLNFLQIELFQFWII